VPIQVNLRASDLKSEIEKVVNNSRLVIQGSGSSRYGLCKFVIVLTRAQAGKVFVNV